MEGVGILLRLRLRQDRFTLLAWAVGLGALVLLSTAGIGNQFDEQARRGLVALMNSNPALLFLRGAPVGTSLGGMIFATLASYLFVLAAIMGVFLGVRHMGAEESDGRVDLLAGTAVGRLAPLAAALAAGAMEQLAVAVAIGTGSLAGGLELSGTALMCAGCFLVGMLGVLIGVLASHLMPTSRAANGAGSAVIAAMFAVRGVGDALGTPTSDLTRLEPSWQVWASPIGWALQSRAFASDGWEQRPWPLLLPLALAAVMAGGLFAAERRREAGVSLIPERAGRAHAGAGLRGVWSLTFRLQRGTLIAWVIVAVLMGQVIGKLAPALADNVAKNPTIAKILSQLGGQDSGTAGSAAGLDIPAIMLRAIGGIVAVLACAAAMQAVQRVKEQESERGELIWAKPVPRTRWLEAGGVIGALTGTAVLGAFALSAGAGLAISGVEHWTEVGRFAAWFAWIVVLFTVLAQLLVALWPNTAGWLSWALLLLFMLGGEFAPLLGDSYTWLQDASPFHWVPDLSDGAASFPHLLLPVALLVANRTAVWLFGRRDARS